MPLFKVKIAIQTFVEIPVFAKNAEEALAYANGTDEWKQDGQFEFFKGHEPFIVSGAEQITDPKDSPFEGDCLCWDSDDTETTAASAFFGNQVPDNLENDEESAAAWEEFFALEEKQMAQFDAARDASKHP